MGLAEQASDLELGADDQRSISSGEPTVDHSQSSDDDVPQPVWIPLKQEIDEIIADCTAKIRTMKELERKRLGNVFGSEKQEQEIEHIQYSITEQIREAEDKLRAIGNYTARSSVDGKMKENIQRTLAMRLQELAGQMRKEQRSYLTKVQEIHGVTLED
jgi:N-methylhydantoinase B/oxoprolinase/acetone carboxylase alpha subunit